MSSAIENVLFLAREAGVSFWPEGSGIHYRAPGPIPVPLRELVVAHKSALMAFLAIWDAVEASRLEYAADSLVEALGVNGRDPVIDEAASRCVTAHYACDMAGVRRECAMVEDRARKLARTGGAT